MNDKNDERKTDDDGSYGWGIIFGFFAGLIGLIISFVIGKSEFRRGTVIGYVLSLLPRLLWTAVVVLTILKMTGLLLI